jgi:uncharacterized protein
MMEPFHDAARAGDLKTLRQLLDGDASLLNTRNALGQSAILLAQYHRQPAAVALLLDAAPELTLHEACAVGHLAQAQALLAMPATRGKLIDQHSSDGFTPLSLACFFGHQPVASWLVGAGASVSLAANNPMQIAPVHAAAAGRHLEILKLLLDAGADANARQQQGFTPLHAAAQQGDLAAIDLLLQHGADRAARSANLQTPLDLALQNGHSAAVERLDSPQ